MAEKAVLLNINPKYCNLIAKRKKIIEIRKTRPNLQTPFKCFIYCTNNKDCLDELWLPTPNGCFYLGNKRVIGEFICDRIYYIGTDGKQADFDVLIAGIHPTKSTTRALENKSQLSGEEIEKYLGCFSLGYGWNISNLTIYDRPKELKDFLRYNRTEDDCRYQHLPLARPENCKICGECRVKRAPTSWCYVEEVTA